MLRIFFEREGEAARGGGGEIQAKYLAMAKKGGERGIFRWANNCEHEIKMEGGELEEIGYHAIPNKTEKIQGGKVEIAQSIKLFLHELCRLEPTSWCWLLPTEKKCAVQTPRQKS